MLMSAIAVKFLFNLYLVFQPNAEMSSLRVVSMLPVVTGRRSAVALVVKVF